MILHGHICGVVCSQGRRDWRLHLRWAIRWPYYVWSWGLGTTTGFRTFKDAGGTHISTGRRKARGMASDGLK